MRDIILEAFQEVLLDESLNQFKKLYAAARRAQAAGNTEKYHELIKKAQAAKADLYPGRAEAAIYGKKAAERAAMARKTRGTDIADAHGKIALALKKEGKTARDDVKNKVIKARMA
jgi:hypothetical protein